MAAIGGAISALAFPRFGPGVLIVVGMAALLWSLRTVERPIHAWFAGWAYGAFFFGILMFWSTELGVIAWLPLILLEGAFYGLFGLGLSLYRSQRPAVWFIFATTGWAMIEWLRYHFPFSGIEWGGAGYAVSGYDVVRVGASVIGASGWTVVIASLGATLALLANGERRLWYWGVFAAPIVLVAIGLLPQAGTDAGETPIRVAIVQGSTPCPYEKCPPNERLGTFEQHLELSKTIAPDSVDLVVWAEGSTGSFNADPVQNPEIGAAIGEQASRIGSWFVVGTDRPVSETEWINANVAFDETGEIVGEYRKQQGVPFGEYIPFRPLFDWIPDLSQVPRDMIPGEGPVVFDAGFAQIGSVISFESSFSRYSLQHARAGANLLVVATNEGSYGTTAVSSQLIGMTRMRAAEIGLPVVHAAVTGKSVLIDSSGDFVTDISGFATREILLGSVQPGGRTVFSYTGDWVMYLAIVIGLYFAWQHRRLLVSGS